MSDPNPPRPDQPSWPPSPAQPVHVPSPAPDRPGRMPALMAAAFVVSGMVFVLGLPVVGRTGGSQTHLHVSLPERQVDRARFPEAASSARLTLQVNPMDSFSDCTTNTANGEPAFLSKCADWQRAGYRAEIFHVTLLSNSDQPIDWSLGQFVLRSESGLPIDALSPSDDAINLPVSGTLRPHGVVTGYIAFNTGDAYVPGALVYQDQDDLVVDVSGP